MYVCQASVNLGKNAGIQFASSQGKKTSRLVSHEISSGRKPILMFNSPNMCPHVPLGIW